MKRLIMSGVGLVVGLILAAMSLVLLVHRPAECGEPASCGDDYLFPAAYLAFALLIGFPILSWVMATKWQLHWIPFLYRLLVASVATASLLGLLSAFV